MIEQREVSKSILYMLSEWRAGFFGKRPFQCKFIARSGALRTQRFKCTRSVPGGREKNNGTMVIQGQVWYYARTDGPGSAAKTY